MILDDLDHSLSRYGNQIVGCLASLIIIGLIAALVTSAAFVLRWVVSLTNFMIAHYYF